MKKLLLFIYMLSLIFSYSYFSYAYSDVNGLYNHDFETGNLDGWTVRKKLLLAIM